MWYDLLVGPPPKFGNFFSQVVMCNLGFLIIYIFCIRVILTDKITTISLSSYESPLSISIWGTSLVMSRFHIVWLCFVSKTLIAVQFVFSPVPIHILSLEYEYHSIVNSRQTSEPLQFFKIISLSFFNFFNSFYLGFFNFSLIWTYCRSLPESHFEYIQYIKVPSTWIMF